MTRPTALALGLLASVASHAADDACRGFELVDVARESGVAFMHDRGSTEQRHLPETMGAGVAWVDVNADGWLDLYVVQSGEFPPRNTERARNRLFINLGTGGFREATEASGADDDGYGQGVSVADFDGDGLEDLYLCNFGADALLRNAGDGTFEDVTRSSGLGAEGWSSSAAMADADGDGDLDLYVTRYVEYDPPEGFYCVDPATDRPKYCDPTLFPGARDVYYENRGDGTFVDATASAGLDGADGKGLAVLFADLDGDDLPDLYVANDLTTNLLFINLGRGGFEDVSLFSGAGLNREGKAEAGMGLALGDVDGDLDPDLVVSNFDVETNTLYINLGRALFEDASAHSGFGTASFNLLGFGTVMADFDLDGNLDVYVANGHIYETPPRDSVTYEQPDLLLMGNGRGDFRRASCGSAFDTRLVGRGLAAADYDNDGDVDLALVNSGGPLQLLRNDGARGNWIGVELEGPPPNTRGVGARIVLRQGGREQVRWVVAGDSYQSSSDKRALFGLGDARRSSEPIEVEVVWPDGESTRHDELQPGSYWRLRPADPHGERVGTGSDSGAGGRRIWLAAALVAIGAASVSLRLVLRRRAAAPRFG
ncbi:MAG: CRTAC1 family protein [bacterium]|nr:CRTAC1 family protein [bacterium]